MTKRMLIDATHDEETRVAVLDGERLEEFDYESKFRKPLKGSIFLAKVTRVEPSLQAAFVNFGGNRHGFLPFSEIHPDYFRIPISDREALLAEQEEALKAHDEEESEAIEESGDDEQDNDLDDGSDVEVVGGNASDDGNGADEVDESEDTDDIDGNVKEPESPDSDEEASAAEDGRSGNRDRRNARGRYRRRMAGKSNRAEVYGEDEDNEAQRFRFNLRRKYKIQEVIKRGQIMLVQVSKEERGNKGAAVTSYLSLPGRYCVLMPNSPRAGGVSRKIASYKDRTRMQEIMKNLEVPDGMSVILRTAGVTRTKAEIKRDLDYLMKLWNSIRELTLESTAPALVYEEANLVKRAVRDLYTRDIEEIYVAGEKGYKSARNFMKMMIPSHVKRVHHYKDEDVPLFQRYRAEEQIAQIGETTVTLKSGGYLVINPTEALVSIDVNSGKATKERHIEETAVKTNLEAAEEVARQLRLRDLGGLIVIDFIDMEDRRNNSKVERRMRDALSGDRARIQVGRISSFGLMEMSRQRMNPSLTESQFETCSHCQGTGRTRTADAASILVLRAIEDEGTKARAAQVIVHVAGDVALYILNNKRENLTALEKRYNFKILIRVDDTMGNSAFRIEVSRPTQQEADEMAEKKNFKSTSNDSGAASGDESGNQRSGRRRGRRGGRKRRQGREEDSGPARDERNEQGEPSLSDDNKVAQKDETASEDAEPLESSTKKAPPRKQRRAPSRKTAGDAQKPETGPALDLELEREDEGDVKTSTSKEKASTRRRKAEKPADDGVTQTVSEAPSSEKDPTEKTPVRGREQPKILSEEKLAEKNPHEKVNTPPKEKKKGWWSR